MSSIVLLKFKILQGWCVLIFKHPRKDQDPHRNIQRRRRPKFLHWRSIGEIVEAGDTCVLEEFGFYLIGNIRAVQQHVVVDEWQNVGANLFPVSVPCVHPLPSVSRCHMTGRCVAVINPQITTHWETEFCHRSPQAEQSETGMCYFWQDCLRR